MIVIGGVNNDQDLLTIEIYDTESAELLYSHTIDLVRLEQPLDIGWSEDGRYLYVGHNEDFSENDTIRYDTHILVIDTDIWDVTTWDISLWAHYQYSNPIFHL